MNHLADETSPYLRQHADNPVEWFPWGDEALRRARAEDKPLFVSIGYASCHWCHVMAHESFEDPETAADLAKSFISVKVDREERPDLDAVYMAATQALTGSGGWPMSVFCTPDGRPFYAGTYFPPVERHGMPSFRRVLQALGDAWTKERAQVLEQADALVGAVQRELRLAEALSEEAAGGAASQPGTRAAAGRRAGRGAGSTPRPSSNRWWRASPADSIPSGADSGRHRSSPVRAWSSSVFGRPVVAGSDAAHARHMGLRTLDAMAAGGIYDHIVGGFCRYSTDAQWLVPHFEKMLTDQAQLARAYLHAWQDGGRAEYMGVVTETLDFVLRDLSTPEGALYSSFDADAGGVEGAHATFTLEELRQILPAVTRRAGGRLVRDHLRRQLGGTVHSGPPRRSTTGAPARGGGGPRAAGRGASRAGPAGPGREGADRVERHDRRHARRGGGRHRSGRLRAARRGDRRVPVGVHVQRRTAHAQLAGRQGASPGGGGGLRLVGRGFLPAVRMDGQGAVA